MPRAATRPPADSPQRADRQQPIEPCSNAVGGLDATRGVDTAEHGVDFSREQGLAARRSLPPNDVQIHDGDRMTSAIMGGYRNAMKLTLDADPRVNLFRS